MEEAVHGKVRRKHSVRCVHEIASIGVGKIAHGPKMIEYVTKNVNPMELFVLL